MPTGRPTIGWRLAVEQYGCTRCGVPPGEPCRTDSDRRRYEPHVDRSNQAREDGWRIIEEPLPAPRL